MGLSQSIYTYIGLFSLLVLSACVKEIGLETEEVNLYFFVDGNIVVGDSTQRLTIGITQGVGTAVPNPLRSANVLVNDLTNQVEYSYTEVASGEYVANFEGEFDTDYQLTVITPTDNTFVTDTLRLAPVPNLTFEGRVDADRRIGPSGDTVITNKAVANIEFHTPSIPNNDMLVFRSSFEYSVSDLICDPFDGAVKCYFEEESTTNLFGLVDLSRYGEGESGVFKTGGFRIDARMAEESVVIVDLFRTGPQAKPYYISIASSQELGNNFFSPQPLTIPGNLVDVRSGTDAALGYFGVIERMEMVLPANSNEIITRAGLAYCSGGTADFFGWNCCYCFRNPGGTAVRPPYWP